MARKSWPHSEEELAAAQVAWLQERDWEVFPEVQLHSGGEVADIVARKDGLFWVIECKMSLSFELLAQAKVWRPRAHYCSIAAPRPSKYSVETMAGEVCQLLGIGLLLWRPSFAYQADEPKGKCLVMQNAAYLRDCDCAKLSSRLTEYHKQYAPGNNRSQRHSPYKETIRQLKEFVAVNPGTSLQTAVKSITHHYASEASARGTIARDLRIGSLKGLVVVMHKGRILLYPEEMDQTIVPGGLEPPPPEGRISK